MQKSQNEPGPRDVFLHLLETIALYIVVGTFIALIFGYIELLFPDLLRFPSSAEMIRNSLRWPLAMLIVVFPFYLWLTRYLQRDVAKNPKKRKLKTRRWLLHLNLFLATIVIAGDLITLIYNFLSGELTISFILKVITVLVIATAAFIYYGWIIKREDVPGSDRNMRIFARIVILLGVIALLAGFVIIGSPAEERKREFDRKRIQDLQSIQRDIIGFWRIKNTLPQSFDSFEETSPGFTPPTDPRTDEPYEYTVTGDLSFELCATFETESEDGSSSQISPRYPGSPYLGQWNHTEGRDCFQRTIDPERFK